MHRGTALLIVGAGVLLVAGCGSSSKSSTGASTAKRTATVTVASTAPGGGAAGAGGQSVRGKVVLVGFHDVKIVPAEVTAKVGSTIVWVNFDSVEHKVQSLTGPAHFSSNLIGEAQAFRVKVTKPGVIRYECFIHPSSMQGTIKVVK